MGTIDELLAELDPDDRASMERIYAVARDEVPEAEQGLGYGMPALVYRGKPLVSVMRAKKHIGIYPFSPAAVTAVAGALEGHPGVSVDKGTIRYPARASAARRRRARARHGSQGADRGLTSGRRVAQWGSTRLTPIAIMTTAMIASRIRHARGVESQRPR